MKSLEPIPQSNTEQVVKLDKLHNFYTAEKSTNLKELAEAGIDTIKSFFKHTNIKNTLRSFLKKDVITRTTDEATEAPTESIRQDSEISHDVTTETKKDYTILKRLNNFESTLMQEEISEYYRQNHIKSINAYIVKSRIPKEKMVEATDRILAHLSKKQLDKFKKTISNKLKNTDLFEEEFGKFWAWRIANPPKEKPLLVRTDTGIEIRSDQFASEAAIKKFMSNHLSTLPDSFFDSITNELDNNEIDSQEPTTIKTSADIEEDITHALKQSTYSIEKQNDSWIDTAMYEKVAHIPAGKALYMLGSINSELKPSARAMLGKMRYMIDPQKTNQTFGSLIQQVLNTENNNLPSKNTLKTISHIINKLNKVASFSEQK